jgi:divalent metal cation (Fe/Co/Zn/Cd) transporter
MTSTDDTTQLARKVRLVSWLSLAWMSIEGAVGVIAGIATNSIALLGYGLDSTIQGIGSLVIIWRFTGSRIDSARAERLAQKIVAITFFLLAPYIGAEALRRLITGEQAEGSWVGIVLALIGITLMPIFGRAKRRLGNELGSAATTGEGTQNLLCAALSLAILFGLAANLFLGLTWADPLVALILALAAARTGRNTWKGRGCAPGPGHPARLDR